ncbi:amidohydrolase [Senegalia sp. (in: firmicutes)]|uniref:amidohydrolase n=1 Tax=Senegalia sp. (in: firmicutes) TaxID=1924098 RepID=UPI003F956C8B
MKAIEKAKEVEQYVIDMRRYFHQHPELSWEEFDTADKIEEELDKMNISHKRVCGTGIIGLIEGSEKRPIIGIRADIDALAVEEDTNLEFKSINDGVMHACGHDAHMAMLLGTAKILNDNKDKLKCTVKLIFQPAEEFIQDSGAKHLALLDEIKDIDNIVGAHIWSYLDTGGVSVESGPRLSSADTFKIEIEGEGGHGAKPDESIDPIITAASIVSNLQTIVSREISPMEPSVLSICSINSGNSANIIPNSAVLEGTTRTFNNEIREKMPERMERIISNISKSFRSDYNFEYYPGTPPTVNEEKSSYVAEEAVKKALGEESLVKYDASMVGEDFSKLLNIIPGCFAFIGARNEEEDKMYAHHSPKFDIDESAMKNGVAFFVQYVLNMQNEI